MASETPNASWHPAMMPNSVADVPRDPPQTTQTIAPGPSDDQPAENAPESLVADDVPEEAHDKSVGPDAWFPDYGTSDSNWMEDAGDAPAATESSTQPDTAVVPESELEPQTQTDDADTESPNPKHASRMSFARTVSHEVPWSDDGDPEWDLSRPAIDPFKFMPENPRSNSFPPVPPLNTQENHDLEQPLPSSQAEDVVQGVQEEESRVAAAFSPVSEDGGFFGEEVQNSDSSHHYMGGDLQGSMEEESDARFTEGVPLISSTDNAPEPTVDQKKPDLFGDEGPNEDDFFSQVQANGSNEPDSYPPQGLERKSTMQVLGDMGVKSAEASFEPLEEKVEEEADATGVETQQKDDSTSPVASGALNHEVDTQAASGEDLDAKWKEMFGEDEDDLLLDDVPETKEFDPAAFLGSDDEGFLEDEEETTPEPPKPAAAAAQTVGTGTQTPNGRYMPSNQIPARPVPQATSYFPTGPTSAIPPSNPYFPSTPTAAIQPVAAAPYGLPSVAPSAPPQYGYGAQPPPPELKKAESFVDKAKGGYESPYDLPMEVVKMPKKRVSMQTLQRTPTSNLAPGPPPPPRSASTNSPLPPPPAASAPSRSSPTLGYTAQPPPTAQAPPRSDTKPQEKFFEELPVVAKPRSASRQSSRGVGSPPQTSPYGPPSLPPPPPVSQFAAPASPAVPAAPPTPSQSASDIPNLVAPPRVNPYASLPSSAGLSPALPVAASSRYSPAPPGAPQVNGSAPPVSTRYSPAPPGARQPSAGYTPSSSAPPLLPHQPRTSSPLAHFEVSHERTRAHAPSQGEGGMTERRTSSSIYDPRLQRVPSLPPTREVEEEEDISKSQSFPQHVLSQPTSPQATRYGPLPNRARQTPPPSSLATFPTSSPKRATSSHAPVAPPRDFAPPPRSQTQSPGALYGNRSEKPAESIPRPSSAHDPAGPRPAVYPVAGGTHIPAAIAPTQVPARPRGVPQNLNLVAPTDGRENDPLQRWRGAPLISWGVGGTIITTFPKDVPRYGMNQSVPMIVRSPGEVKLQHVKDIQPLEERLSKFPGPLKGKSKKKETIAWLTSGIESLERNLSTNPYGHAHVSHDDKRVVERVLLWKILRLFIEHDGSLEGNPTVEKSVRDLLAPDAETSGDPTTFMTGASMAGLTSTPATSMQADAVDSSTVDQIRRHLLTGDREKAVWAAADKRMWGHALLIANALAPELYKQVAQEFVKKEVNFPGHNNESMAALYEVLAGNHEESVDELVPVHARAGLQLVAKDSVSGPSKDAMEGLDNWRETLCLILSNRSTGDAKAINSLGNLLSSYGRAEAAHICFLFSKSHTVFGGLDDPASNFVLVGSDHRRQAEQFAKEIEPLLLSEVYEYGQSLAAGANVPVSNPHLAAYKLQHAYALAEYGYRDKALQYCEAIATAITAQTRRSPYHHPILETAVDDLMTRLRQAPKEESSSWIPKPSMNKVTDSVWNRFNKFVAGDDDGSGQGSPKDNGESGPFARIAGGTPTISRPPSAGLETFGAAVPNFGLTSPPGNGSAVAPPAPVTRAASRYAPAVTQPAVSGNSSYEPSSYAPRSSMERSSGEYGRGSTELSRKSLDIQSGYSNPYSPNRTSSPAQNYAPPQGAGLGLAQESSYTPSQNPIYTPQIPVSSPGYEPMGSPNGVTNGANSYPAPAAETKSEDSPAIGYQPPSYGYEPPSLTPYEAPAETTAEDKDKAESEEVNNGGYEPPSYQPYGYEPPSYEPEQPSNDADDSGEESKPKPKKKGIMYDDEDDFPISKPAQKSREEIDRENQEMFRKAAEEDGKLSPQCL